MADLRVLVVEDETIVAMDIAAGLKRRGYTVVGTVSNGEAAVAAASRHAPDLILMDIRLQGAMDGIDAARAIRAKAKIPIIFLSAYADSSTVERAKAVMPHGYLLKPFDERDLHRTIDLAVSRARAEEFERARADEALWHSEERFRLLVDAIDDYALVLTDLRGQVMSWNSGAQRLTGYREDDIVGRSFGLFISPDARPEELDAALADLLARGKKEEEGWRLRRDGSKFWGRSVHFVVRDRGGDPRGFAVVMRDETDRRRLQAELLQSQKLESLGKLAGGVAHDFNNMLMVMFSRAEMLQRQSLNDRQSRFVEDMISAAQKSRELTQQLLAAARRQMMQPEVVNLSALVASTMRLLEVSLGEAIEVRTELRQPLWSIFADPGKIHQVLLNLVVNAREAMPSGGTLSLETRNFRADASYVRQHPQLSPGEYVMLIVSDSGSGIPPGVIEKIYDPFFTTKAAGTGLGLSVVRGIVEQTGGQIWLYSEVGEGSSFKIFFPRYLASGASSLPPPASEEPGGTETILVVEDEQLVRTIICETLSEHGYRVIEADSPAAAIRIARESTEPIDLLLTDLIMPGMNGRSLAEELIAARPSLRVLFMSGYTDQVIADRDILSAAVHFLEKPATTMQLLKAVREALGDDQPK